MPDSVDIEKRIAQMLDMGDEQLMAEIKEAFLVSDERHQRISEALEEMIAEVDRLLVQVDEMETESLDECVESEVSRESEGSEEHANRG